MRLAIDEEIGILEIRCNGEIVVWPAIGKSYEVYNSKLLCGEVILSGVH
jgi:hypothetical protein